MARREVQHLSQAAETQDFYEAIMCARSGGIHDDIGFLEMAELQDQVVRLTRDLKRRDAKCGEPILIAICGNANDVVGILAVIGAGAIAVPIHHKSHPDYTDHVRKITGARFYLDASDPERAREPRIKQISNRSPSYHSLLDGAAFVTFTSGSTGTPKGVVLARERVSAKYHAIRTAIDLQSAPVALVPLQLLFSFGQWATFLPLMSGGTIHMTGRYSSHWVARKLETSEINYLAAVPTMLRMLAGSAISEQSFQVLTGGEAVGSRLRQTLFEFWPHATIKSIYGLTETGTCDLFRRDQAPDNGGNSLGFPSPNVEVAIDPENRELLIRSPYNMLGYLEMPELSAETLREGWIHTGDQAEILPTGEVVLAGRIKELINRGGNKVSPLEVETTFQQHPNVSAALATAVPDKRFGEAIHLLIVPTEATEITASELMDWATPRLERFKLPDVIHFGKELPLGNTGKSDRSALGRLILEQGRAE